MGWQGNDILLFIIVFRSIWVDKLCKKVTYPIVSIDYFQSYIFDVYFGPIALHIDNGSSTFKIPKRR